MIVSWRNFSIQDCFISQVVDIVVKVGLCFGIVNGVLHARSICSSS